MSNKYNHEAKSIEEAVGVNDEKLSKKLKRVLSTIKVEHQEIPSYVVEKFEENFTKKELAYLFNKQSMISFDMLLQLEKLKK